MENKIERETEGDVLVLLEKVQLKTSATAVDDLLESVLGIDGLRRERCRVLEFFVNVMAFLRANRVANLRDFIYLFAGGSGSGEFRVRNGNSTLGADGAVKPGTGGGAGGDAADAAGAGAGAADGARTGGVAGASSSSASAS